MLASRRRSGRLYAAGRRLAGRASRNRRRAAAGPSMLFVSYAVSARVRARRTPRRALLLLSPGSSRTRGRGAIAYVLTTTPVLRALLRSSCSSRVLTVVAVQRRAAFSRRWIVIVGLVAVLCAPEAYGSDRRRAAGHLLDPAEPAPISPRSQLHAQRRRSRTGRDPFALAGFGAVVAVRGGGGRAGAPRWKVGLAWLSVPVALAFILSFVQLIFAFHYLLVTMPAFVVLSAGNRPLGAPGGSPRVDRRRRPLGTQRRELVRPAQTQVTSSRGRRVPHDPREADRLLVWPQYASTALSYYLDRAPGGGARRAARASAWRAAAAVARHTGLRGAHPGRLKAFEGTPTGARLVSSALSGVTEASRRNVSSRKPRPAARRGPWLAVAGSGLRGALPAGVAATNAAAPRQAVRASRRRPAVARERTVSGRTVSSRAAVAMKSCAVVARVADRGVGRGVEGCMRLRARPASSVSARCRRAPRSRRASTAQVSSTGPAATAGPAQYLARGSPALIDCVVGDEDPAAHHREDLADRLIDRESGKVGGDAVDRDRGPGHRPGGRARPGTAPESAQDAGGRRGSRRRRRRSRGPCGRGACVLEVDDGAVARLAPRRVPAREPGISCRRSAAGAWRARW